MSTSCPHTHTRTHAKENLHQGFSLQKIRQNNKPRTSSKDPSRTVSRTPPMPQRKWAAHGKHTVEHKRGVRSAYVPKPYIYGIWVGKATLSLASYQPTPSFLFKHHLMGNCWERLLRAGLCDRDNCTSRPLDGPYCTQSHCPQHCYGTCPLLTCPAPHLCPPL